MTLSPAQLRAARALLAMSQDELAQLAKVAKRTIAAFEAGQRDPYDRTQQALRCCLENAGCLFIEPDRHGEGVRLRDP
ncbi:helix-turn-helix transcriptional regulator [Acidocella facilis]|uniref:helix-turn-helix transcriptional regulator n=1 Tax=Acidocella facilis TaxID=525 RepID=UPI00047D5100|nr:helix-turn-helix domain-containing protein [Acidocella facilis]